MYRAGISVEQSSRNLYAGEASDIASYNASRITGTLWVESTGYRWIPITKCQLSWHVQGCGMIGSLFFKQELYDFGFEIWIMSSSIRC